MKPLFSRAVSFWKRYEHWLGVGALCTGFIFDLFLAKTPNNIIDNILLCTYLLTSGTIIILFNVRSRRELVGGHPVEPLALLLILQFCFGGLASNLLVLYGKSGTPAGDLIFVGLLLCMVFGNEYMRSRYAQLRFNIAIYYTLLFSYLTISIPTFILHAIGPEVFLITGGISLVLMIPFFIMLRIAVSRGKRERRLLWEAYIIVISIFVFFNVLYFLNIIPPVPLSLKDIGVYHSLSRDVAGNYTATYEPPPWYEFWQDTSTTYTYGEGQTAYCFSAVYAPPNFDTPIYHRWEQYDDATKTWNTVFRVSFSLVGGRAGGYRGYSYVVMTPGQWRCDVETADGQLIGRISFTAVLSSTTPQFKTTTL